ncbi:hypothetical protein CYMTET_44975 [Cymbomonas tetramitiformis]|uniref:PWWP domain-containing protein n=1 Tax=Cymbomonas tetramitiformis TaxID=36881 RepID=A0AAE0EZ18_9CHLO|nr:hypothetical protein CYMTET_44975 [Cymbomonas tetramitiformis]
MDNAYSDQLDVPILDIGEPQWDFFYLDLKGFTDDHPVSSSLQGVFEDDPRFGKVSTPGKVSGESLYLRASYGNWTDNGTALHPLLSTPGMSPKANVSPALRSRDSSILGSSSALSEPSGKDPLSQRPVPLDTPQLNPQSPMVICKTPTPDTRKTRSSVLRRSPRPQSSPGGALALSGEPLAQPSAAAVNAVVSCASHPDHLPPKAGNPSTFKRLDTSTVSTSVPTEQGKNPVATPKKPAVTAVVLDSAASICSTTPSKQGSVCPQRKRPRYSAEGKSSTVEASHETRCPDHEDSCTPSDEDLGETSREARKESAATKETATPTPTEALQPEPRNAKDAVSMVNNEEDPTQSVKPNIAQMFIGEQLALKTGKKAPGYQSVGLRVSVFWPRDADWYEGVIKAFDESNGRHWVVYEDGDKEYLHLARQTFEWRDQGSLEKLNTRSRKTKKEAEEVLFPQCLERGTYVWAKVKGHGYWPGVVFEKPQKSSSHYAGVNFFDGSHGKIECSDILPFGPYLEELQEGKQKPAFLEATQEAIKKFEKDQQRLCKTFLAREKR